MSISDPFSGVANCPGCQASAWHEITGRDHSYRLFQCSSCGCCRIDWTQTSHTSDLYDDEYYSEGSAQRLAGIFDTVWRWKRRSRAKLILRWAPKCARVCDIGCERGELLNVLARSGCRVSGTQLSKSAAEFARRRFGIDVDVGELTNASLPSGAFDAVLMLNVVEHLQDPDSYVATVAQMLSAGGVFWVETPNAGSFTARVSGKNWLHFDPPHHVWMFDKAGISQLLVRHGFAIEQIYHHNWEFNPIGSLQSWLNFLPGPKNVIFEMVRRGFGSDRHRLSIRLTHLLLSVVLLPFAFLVAAVEGTCGNGQVLLIRARKNA